jgi:hypothetical protein
MDEPNNTQFIEIQWRLEGTNVTIYISTINIEKYKYIGKHLINSSW